jgi:transcriptional regulator with XRE-family HTH domain
MLTLEVALAMIHSELVDSEELLAEGTRRRVYWTMQLRGYGQTELEGKAGVGFGTLANFFAGRRATAQGSKLWILKIADALDVDVGWLNTGREPDPKRAFMDMALPPIPADRRKRPSAPSAWVAKNLASSAAWNVPKGATKAKRSNRKKRT